MASDALSLLAIRFEQDGFPLHAIHCLQGLLSLKLLPEQEARARCKLGHLLVNHTMNLKLAKSQLKQAVSYTVLQYHRLVKQAPHLMQ
jgi:hypothetical protein